MNRSWRSAALGLVTLASAGSGCAEQGGDPFSGTWVGVSDLSEWTESEACAPGDRTALSGDGPITLDVWRLADDGVAVDLTGVVSVLLVGDTDSNQIQAEQASTFTNGAETSSTTWTMEGELDEAEEQLDGSLLYESTALDDTFCSQLVPFSVVRRP